MGAEDDRRVGFTDADVWAAIERLRRDPVAWQAYLDEAAMLAEVGVSDGLDDVQNEHSEGK